MRGAPLLYEKYLACVWHNFVLWFLPTSLYSETPKAQTFLLLLFQYGVCCEEDERCCYLQNHFKEEWLKQYRISRSDGNPYAFYCIPCKKSVFCSHQGLSDVTKQCKRLTHVPYAKAIKNNQSMTTFLADNDEDTNSLKVKTIQADVLHTNFLVHHNLSFFFP